MMQVGRYHKKTGDRSVDKNRSNVRRPSIQRVQNTGVESNFLKRDLNDVKDTSHFFWPR